MTKKKYDIEQSYIGRGARIRIQKKDNKAKYLFTFKQIVESEVVEIEKKISKLDYDLLHKESTNVVYKTRYKVGDWDVDFFKHEGENYFVMAEIELPRGQKEPNFIPKFIEDNLIYVVEVTDQRFSSKKLSNVEYAKVLLEEISEKSYRACNSF